MQIRMQFRFATPCLFIAWSPFVCSDQDHNLPVWFVETASTFVFYMDLLQSLWQPPNALSQPPLSAGAGRQPATNIIRVTFRLSNHKQEDLNIIGCLLRLNVEMLFFKFLSDFVRVLLGSLNEKSVRQKPATCADQQWNIRLYGVNVQCLRIFYVIQPRTTTVVYSNLKTLVFIIFVVFSNFISERITVLHHSVYVYTTSLLIQCFMSLLLALEQKMKVYVFSHSPM